MRPMDHRLTPLRAAATAIGAHLAAPSQKVEAGLRSAYRLLRGPAGVALAVAVAVAILALLADTFRHIRWQEIEAAIAATEARWVLVAIAATVGSYAALVGFEWLALRQVQAPVRPAAAAITALIAYSFTFVLGFGVLTGGAVRLRRYKTRGLTNAAILAVTLLGTVSFWLGIAGLAGLCLLAAPDALAPTFGIDDRVGRVAGALIVLALGGWVASCGLTRRTMAVGDWQLSLPGAGTLLAVLALGIAQTGLAALALWLLLPESVAVAFPAFLVVFTMATVAGVVSHAPGGLGAFEAVMLLSFPPEHRAALVGALICFRAVYYALPFALGGAAFIALEIGTPSPKLIAAREALARTIRPLLPRLAGMMVFVAGLILLLSAAMPADTGRAALLDRVLPLPSVEASHFVASLAGAALLIVGYGLMRRLHSSWRIAVAILSGSALLSLLTGIDGEIAGLCILILALLVVSRREFYRRSADAAMSRRWLCAVTLALAASVLAGLMVYGGPGDRPLLWWQIGPRGEIPRVIPILAGAVLVIAFAAAWRALHRPCRPLADAPDARRIAHALAAAEEPSAHLAHLGDKHFLFSDLGDGFVMYAVYGSTFLAMGNPVGADSRTTVDLIWRFKELADRHGGRAAFYQVSSQYLPLYIDAGFSFAKLGEEAVVDLGAFSLAGSRAARHRQRIARAERAGLRFELLCAADVPERLGALKAVSDTWLQRQKGREKGFSLGFFDAAYLARFDHAVLRLDGAPVAFASLWRTADGRSAAIDLMRHVPGLPHGAMDYLFLSLLGAMKAAGVERLNLGMAPLSGLTAHRLAPAWSRLGDSIFRHGSQLYNFRGLRAFKEKFDPEWCPRYLAHTGGFSAARALVDATLIISRGPRGVVGPPSRPAPVPIPRPVPAP
ncbi:bifunctional lysylphosphatidylglycerol flippase/synthetase MprF [Acuticoccus mangrovi]|uniref:Phosphatidylglycerol lysyltransferase n=1 Tax=Acuticoccus mangrovi TaxID=2796142 RepID=A0A934ILP6_9HYPH|nr:bifunctional lysylphosphatidylglycerol flippase/synthetase MprF [Acuticoccus mangrovi]MBJ3774225.1 bifunctional lysylphosphatidylglycerol flippase/synthetase MprF [Acuticoccus mangrovi]